VKISSPRTRNAIGCRAYRSPSLLDDVKKVLSAGCPVHVSMNTGGAFSEVGRDGLFNAAEAPSGMHGRHAMLMVGYTGNFFTVKNSWAPIGAIKAIATSQECSAESDPSSWPCY